MKEKQWKACQAGHKHPKGRRAPFKAFKQQRKGVHLAWRAFLYWFSGMNANLPVVVVSALKVCNVSSLGYNNYIFGFPFFFVHIFKGLGDKFNIEVF